MTLILIVFLNLIALGLASNGDRSPFFQSCVKKCYKANCEGGASEISEKKLYQILFQWSCNDECVYECMWKTSDAFLARQWRLPQFYGKWPFVRIFGIQEPASVLFSILNLVANLNMIYKFRKKVRPDSPNFILWQVFCVICCNAWMWSIVFHTRDLPLTELMDYGFAYAMVLASFVCMLLRMFHKSAILRSFISATGLLWFAYHFLCLSGGKFDYQFNMKMNVITGIMSGTGWLLWYIFYRHKRAYAWKILAFQIFAALSLLLELNDFPPLYYTFDAHSLWHLSTVPLTVIFYQFVIDDCVTLRQEKFRHLEEVGAGDAKKLI